MLRLPDMADESPTWNRSLMLSTVRASMAAVTSNRYSHLFFLASVFSSLAGSFKFLSSCVLCLITAIPSPIKSMPSQPLQAAWHSSISDLIIPSFRPVHKQSAKRDQEKKQCHAHILNQCTKISGQFSCHQDISLPSPSSLSFSFPWQETGACR